MIPPLKFYPRLHWLRGFLAIAVVVSHLQHVAVWGRSPDPLTPLTSVGGLAVHVFFLLSRFVMLKAVWESPSGFRSLLVYLARRGLRIYPAYWFFLGLTALFVFYGGATWDSAQLPGHDWLAGWTLFSCKASPFLPMAVAWSLFCEVAFYLALGFVVWSRKAAWVVLPLFLFGSIAFRPGSAPPFHGLQVVNELFFLGMLLAVAEHRWRWVFSAWPLYLSIGLVLVPVSLLSLAWWGEKEQKLASFLIVAGILGWEYAGPSRLPSVVQSTFGRLGDASFSIYVGHTLTQSILHAWLGYPAGFFRVDLYVLAPVLVSLVTFRLIEKPCIRFGKMLDPGTPAPSRR